MGGGRITLETCMFLTVIGVSLLSFVAIQLGLQKNRLKSGPVWKVERKAPTFSQTTVQVTNDGRSNQTHTTHGLSSEGGGYVQTYKLITSGPSFVDSSDIGETMEIRRRHLMTMCPQQSGQFGDISQNGTCNRTAELTDHVIVDKNKTLAICIIPGNAQKLWKQILYIISGKSKSRNPYLVSDKDLQATSAILQIRQLGHDVNEQLDVIHSSRKVVFVRDPFVRLLSMYLSTLYLPMPKYWSTIGKDIRAMSGLNTTTCAHNVTFLEFVQYFIHIHREDNCTTPEYMLHNYQIAQPCEIKYDFIGKYENLEKETLFIISQLNQSKHVGFPHFKADADTELITELVDVTSLDESGEELEKCGVTLKQAFFRIWRYLQGKGILGTYDKFPVKFTGIWQKSGIQRLLMYHHIFGGDADNRNGTGIDLLAVAYSEIPDSIIAELQGLFKVDLELFGYDPYPYYIRTSKTYGKLLKHRLDFLEMR